MPPHQPLFSGGLKGALSDLPPNPHLQNQATPKRWVAFSSILIMAIVVPWSHAQDSKVENSAIPPSNSAPVLATSSIPSPLPLPPPPPPVPPSTVREYTPEQTPAFTIAENKRKAVTGADTATSRLQALAAQLDAALAALRQTPPETIRYFIKTTADILQAKADVASGLDYVKAHPEGNSLALHPHDSKFDGQIKPPWIRPWSAILDPDGAPNLFVVEQLLTKGLDEFVGNPYDGRPILGDIGGSRDRIVRAVVAAWVDLAVNYREFRPPNPAIQRSEGSLPNTVLSANALTNGSANSGTIAGSVKTVDGKPLADALISVKVVGSLDANFIDAGLLLPATISDEHGDFVITNLPPGFYSVASTNRVVVEVKAGVETKLPGLIKQMPAPPPRGRVGG